MIYRILSFRWMNDAFLIAVHGVSDHGQHTEDFELTFGSPSAARDAFTATLAAAANARWGTDILPAQVFGTGIIPDLQPTDNAGRPLIALAGVTSVGLPNITIQNMPDDCATYRRSWLIECPPLSITLRDLCITHDLVGPTGRCFVASSFFGCATEARLGSELQIDLIDRDDVLGYFPYIGASRSKLAGLTDIEGTFQANEEVRGSACRARVLSVGADFLEITFDRWDKDGKISTFTDGESIVGQRSGASATLATPAFTEGGFLFIQRFIMDEALYGFKSHEEKPGGAKEIPPGLYFRCAVYNAHPTETLFVDGTIGIGKK